VAHTTVKRTLEGHPVDLPTLITFANWIGVSPASILNAEGNKLAPDTVAAKIAAIVEAVPELKEVFIKALDRVDSNQMTIDALRELVAYATYRLSLMERKNEHERAGEPGVVEAP
jgi:DNA-binding XRE family transcriptional regulator